MAKKYLAVKVKGLDHYLWFKSENVANESGKFVGKDGWGKRGANTDLETYDSEIISTISSDALQYE